MSEEVILYVGVSPPVRTGGVQVKYADAFLASTVNPVGGSGAVMKYTLFALSADVPTEFTALIANLYWYPVVNADGNV